MVFWYFDEIPVDYIDHQINNILLYCYLLLATIIENYNCSNIILLSNLDNINGEWMKWLFLLSSNFTRAIIIFKILINLIDTYLIVRNLFAADTIV